MLYPLKFRSIFKEKLWGGQKLGKFLNKDIPETRIGESWEISGLEGNFSEISEGFLQGNDLEDVLETYMGELVGEPVYEKFGRDFPLLFKFIDAADDLSVQVHPDDALARERYGLSGKNELWYIVQADEGAELILGFEENFSKSRFLELVEQRITGEYLHRQKVKAGDAFFIPAGLVHSIGKGVLLAEIQQSSDITYRIDDRNRKDKNGKMRELHVAQAADAVDFDNLHPSALKYGKEKNTANLLFESEYFTVNYLKLDRSFETDYNYRESFTVYMCIEGAFKIDYPDGQTKAETGESVLIPAALGHADLHPKPESKILEVFINNKFKKTED